MNTKDFDAIVIGGGPAGSAASTALALMGRRVILVEREPGPRYHIGESLIPYTWFPLQRIGMLEKMKASHFVHKHSVQFVSTTGKLSQPFYFFKHTDHPCAQTWQVLRSEFDAMLLDNAREKGVEVRQGVTAREPIRDPSGAVIGVEAVDAGGNALTLRAPVTVDASGRDMFMASRHRWRINDPQLRKMAIWSYWKGAKRVPGVDEGATIVAYVPEKGWFWYIPLPDDIISVGIVAEADYLYRDGRDLDQIYAREVAGQPWVREQVAPGTKTMPCKVTSDYTYRCRHCAADGVVLVGDAFQFLDPVFSSGVFIALQSGVMAADAVNAALDAEDYSAARFTEYGQKLNAGIESMRRLVYAFYDQNFNFGALFRKYPHLHRDLTDCLIGNLWKDFDPLFTAVAEFAQVPPRIEHGGPAMEVPNSKFKNSKLETEAAGANSEL